MLSDKFIKDGYVHRIDLINASDEELLEISKSLGLALNLEEMKRIQEYFKKRNRLPTDVELEALAQSWSEHCCYKSSKYYLRQFVYKIAKDKIVAREDAGVLEFDEKHYYVVALESHNHPSAIEPYGGAATGIGGILRDVLCMGAQPIALIDPLFFGMPDVSHEKLPKGIKHPRYLFKRVVEGIRDYGNRVGIPTVAGQIYFHPSYLGNCLVNVGCVGIVKKDKLVHSKVKKPGDVLVYAGGKTGRDGIHGVTFASEELREESEEKSITAVQLGDPITKEPLIHACLECNEKGLVEGMKDMGGGGLSCVCSEIAYEGGYGAEVYLDRVPLREKDMEPWEIWVSESQERMLLVVKEENLEKVLEIFEKWDVEAVPIGKVIEEPVIRIFYKNQLVGELELLFQVGAVEYQREWKKPEIKEKEDIEFEMPDLQTTLLKILASYNVCSRDWVIRQYDFEVRGATVVKPLNGLDMSSHSDAVVIKPLEDSYKGLAITADINPYYTSLNPYWGTCSAIDEACRNLAAVGARIDSIADCLNFGNPEKPERMGEFVECLKALHDMASQLNIPFASGNVSFYNESMVGSVAPTPTIMAIGIVNDVRKCVTTDFKQEGNPIYLIGETKKEMGGSEYYMALGIEGGKVPRSNAKVLKKSMEKVVEAIENGYISACHDISNGGLAVALAEMVIAGKGAEICLYPLPNLRTDFKLFSESNTRWVVEVKKDKEEEFKKLFDSLSTYKIGYVKGDRLIIYDGDEMTKYVDLSRKELFEAWNKRLWKEMG